MNPTSGGGGIVGAVEQGVNMIAGGVEGGILGSGNLVAPTQIVPAPDYRPYLVLGFGALVALILWKD
jgi:hypothetical protein